MCSENAAYWSGPEGWLPTQQPLQVKDAQKPFPACRTRGLANVKCSDLSKPRFSTTLGNSKKNGTNCSSFDIYDLFKNTQIVLLASHDGHLLFLTKPGPSLNKRQREMVSCVGAEADECLPRALASAPALLPGGPRTECEVTHRVIQGN